MNGNKFVQSVFNAIFESFAKLGLIEKFLSKMGVIYKGLYTKGSKLGNVRCVLPSLILLPNTVLADSEEKVFVVQQS